MPEEIDKMKIYIKSSQVKYSGAQVCLLVCGTEPNFKPIWSLVL